MSDPHSNASGPGGLDFAAPDNDDDPAGLPRALLGDRSLEEAIEGLVTHVRDTTSFSTSLQFDGWEPIDDHEKARHVFRIVRDAVAHAVMHSGGTHIVVSLARHVRQCQISIFDIGGHNTAGHATEDGGRLDEVRDRMEASASLIDAAIEIERRPTGGMAIALSFSA
jgi:nitrate/nitrite-specific signal transduction histidine kinase